MKVKIKISTLEEMTQLTFKDNKMAFATEIKKHGIRYSEKTIIRAIEGLKENNKVRVEPYISDFVTFPVLLRMCEFYKYPLFRCFTFYTEPGVEKPVNSSHPDIKHIEEPIHTNLLRLACDICNIFPRLAIFRHEMGIDFDFLQLANENVNALEGISATDLVEKLMMEHLDINNYLWQGDFRIPYQMETTSWMVAEDILPDREHEYLSALINLKMNMHNSKMNLDKIIREINQHGYNLVDKNPGHAFSIFELLSHITQLLQPFTIEPQVPQK